MDDVSRLESDFISLNKIILILKFPDVKSVCLRHYNISLDSNLLKDFLNNHYEYELVDNYIMKRDLSKEKEDRKNFIILRIETLNKQLDSINKDLQYYLEALNELNKY